MNYQNNDYKIELQTQTNPLWAFKTMALPEDRIGLYGCLVTAITNLYNMIYEKNETVLNMNERIKNLKLYSGLKNPNLEKYYHSFLLTDDFLKILSLKKIEVSECTTNNWYYCRVNVLRSNNQTIGHYTNLFFIDNKYFIFDVYDGNFKMISKKAISNIYEVSKL